MTPDTLSSAIDVLHGIAAGAGSAEVDALLDVAEGAAKGEGREHEFEAFRQHVGSLRRGLLDSAVAERGLSLLIDTTHDLSKTLELDELLRTIVSRARSLVGAHLAWVTVLDQSGDLFRTVTAEGNLSPAVAEMKSRIDVGAVGLMMKSKDFFETQDYLGDTRFRHSQELDRTFEHENIVSLAGFPIISDGDIQGFLFVADRYSRKLSGREVSVLGSFALHAGVAMRNASAFSLLSAALEEAQRNRNALLDHIKRVEASAAAHDEMTTLLATGAELRQFLERMALQIGGAVFLFDVDMAPSGEVVSPEYGGTLAADLRTASIDPKLLVTAALQSRHSGRSVVVLQRGDEHCRAVALHGGTDRSETLVICHRGELDAIDIRNIERSAVALSIAKLWNEKRETERLIASSTLLRHLVLVTPADTATTSAIRDRLGLGANQPIVLCLLAISNLERTAQTAIVRDCAARANVLVDLFHDTYLAAGSDDAIRAFVRTLVERQDGWSAGGLVSEPIADLAITSVHFGELSRALRAIRKMRPLIQFVDYRDISLFARIMGADDSERLMRDISRVLRPLDDLPVRQRVESKRTLLAYFDSQHNATRTAATLGLHINTIRQRLDAIRDVAGGWDDPVRALELHFALRLEALFERPPQDAA